MENKRIVDIKFPADYRTGDERNDVLDGQNHRIDISQISTFYAGGTQFYIVLGHDFTRDGTIEFLLGRFNGNLIKIPLFDYNELEEYREYARELSQNEMDNLLDNVDYIPSFNITSIKNVISLPTNTNNNEFVSRTVAERRYPPLTNPPEINDVFKPRGIEERENSPLTIPPKNKNYPAISVWGYADSDKHYITEEDFDRCFAGETKNFPVHYLPTFCGHREFQLLDNYEYNFLKENYLIDHKSAGAIYVMIEGNDWYIGERDFNRIFLLDPTSKFEIRDHNGLNDSKFVKLEKAYKDFIQRFYNISTWDYKSFDDEYFYVTPEEYEKYCNRNILYGNYISFEDYQHGNNEQNPTK